MDREVALDGFGASAVETDGLLLPSSGLSTPRATDAFTLLPAFGNICRPRTCIFSRKDCNPERRELSNLLQRSREKLNIGV